MAPRLIIEKVTSHYDVKTWVKTQKRKRERKKKKDGQLERKREREKDKDRKTENGRESLCDTFCCIRLNSDVLPIVSGCVICSRVVEFQQFFSTVNQEFWWTMWGWLVGCLNVWILVLRWMLGARWAMHWTPNRLLDW